MCLLLRGTRGAALEAVGRALQCQDSLGRGPTRWEAALFCVRVTTMIGDHGCCTSGMFVKQKFKKLHACVPPPSGSFPLGHGEPVVVFWKRGSATLVPFFLVHDGVVSASSESIM